MYEQQNRYEDARGRWLTSDPQQSNLSIVLPKTARAKRGEFVFLSEEYQRTVKLDFFALGPCEDADFVTWVL